MGLCNGVDRETVVKGLEQFIADFKPFYGNREDWKRVYDALDLLKEPEVVEPVLDADTWACGNCNHPVEHDYLVGPNVWFHELHNFCPFCGKKVDWVDKEIK